MSTDVLASVNNFPQPPAPGEQIIGVLRSISTHAPDQVVIAQIDSHEVVIPRVRGLKALVGQLVCVTRVGDRTDVRRRST